MSPAVRRCLCALTKPVVVFIIAEQVANEPLIAKEVFAVLINVIKAAKGDAEIIAEDLGETTPEVQKLVDESGFPLGMWLWRIRTNKIKLKTEGGNGNQIERLRTIGFEFTTETEESIPPKHYVLSKKTLRKMSL